MLLELRDIEKSFEGKRVLRGISLVVATGEIVVLLGPSGCGKTTLLRIIAGLESADHGWLLLQGDDLTRTPVHERAFGMVFQDYALFPHKSVAENVSFGLRMKGWSRDARSERVSALMNLVQLGGFENRPIHELSGGEQQRVALARSLAPAPRLLLLDEPLGSLDRALRERLMGELRLILKRAGGVLDHPEGITTIYVTHDQEEAFAIADRVLVMNAGRIEQSGTPLELYRRPSNAFVAQFLGMVNLLEARILSLDPPTVRTALGDLEVSPFDPKLSDDVTLLIRPNAASFVTGQPAGANIVSGQIVAVSFRGRHQVATVNVPSDKTVVKLVMEFDSNIALPEPGSSVVLDLSPNGLLVLECC